ncbi:MAG: PHB depolymerase family esterase [Archangium sp.]|nr:PHB depolymerase family esterase [Archangium sp.]
MRLGLAVFLLLGSPDAGQQVVFGGARPVTLSVPRAYAGRPTPLLLVLHGYGSSGKHHEKYLGLDRLVEERGVLVASPDGTPDSAGGRFWNTGSDACCNFRGSDVDDVKYLRGLIAEIRGVYNVDPRRIYVLGHSNGGFMAHRLGCELSKELAAVVSIAGSTPLERCKTPMSVLQIHGDRDYAVRYDGGVNILGRGGGAYVGAEESASRWARDDKCKLTRTSRERLDLVSTLPGAETMVGTYDGCPAGTDVTLWTMQGGLHVPDFGPQFPSLVWGWLEAHPRP